jgi:hypothetical protein
MIPNGEKDMPPAWQMIQFRRKRRRSGATVTNKVKGNPDVDVHSTPERRMAA